MATSDAPSSMGAPIGLALPLSVVVGIVGAGTMGAGIAHVAAMAGHRVRLFDTRPGAAQATLERIVVTADKLVAKERMMPTQAQEIRVNLQAVDTLQSLAGCGLVIEAIVEDLHAKRRLLCDLEEISGPATILATNTSSISVTAIGSALRRPQQLAGMHFFNPAPLMPLVEIVQGVATAQAVLDTLYATALRWGKMPVHVRSTPGFIVNRIARPFYVESLRVLSEGACDCATIDAIMREAGGFRMGPFELMDLIGNDVNYAVTRSVFDAFYGDRRYQPSLQQLALVEAGFLGRKTGRGFYLYGVDTLRSSAHNAENAPAPLHVNLYGEDALAHVLAQRLGPANVSVERCDAHPDQRIAMCDSFVLYRSDGRSATARAAGNHIGNTVLVDYALEYSKAPRLAVAIADQADTAVKAAAAGLLQAVGYTVSVIDDVPGMIVMRTIAMLANEAADALHQSIATAADIDLAMQRGMNYPRGPLTWADEIGLGKIVQVLEHLEQSYGEDRYRVSPLLRRKVLAGRQLFDTPARTISKKPEEQESSE